MKIKKGSPVPLSVNMYWLLGFLLLTCIKTKICFIYGRFLHEGGIQNILQCLVF